MVTIEPRRGALKEAADALDPAAPVIMVNLLRFNDQAAYANGTQRSGPEAYRTYARHTAELLEARGARVLFHGTARGMLIAPDTERWDEVLLVRYPNFAAFVSMVHSDEYQRIVFHRTAALKDSRLYATQEH